LENVTTVWLFIVQPTDWVSELKEEKIVPHLDKWMSLNGDFRYFGYNESMRFKPILIADLLPKYFKNKTELDIQFLAILTLTSQLEFITLTIKEIRGLDALKSKPSLCYLTSICSDPFLRIQVYEGNRMTSEQECTLNQDVSEPPVVQQNQVVQNGPNSSRRHPPTVPSSPQLQQNHVNRLHRRTFSERHIFVRRESTDSSSSYDGESFLLKVSPIHLHNSFIVVQVGVINKIVHFFFQLHANRVLPRERRHLPSPVDEGMEIVEDEGEPQIGPPELIGCCAIGAVVLGSSKCFYHWQQMIEKLGNPVPVWHKFLGKKH
jgi:hypothetical protein